MSPGLTFERVYLALKEQLGRGRFAPGDHLEPAILGPELNASVTPVRDALHRLVGERIVEAPRNDGFRVPAPTEADLRDLYGWNQMLLGHALRTPASYSSATLLRPPVAEAEPASDGAAALFRIVARRAGTGEIGAAIDNMNDRLASLRIAEGRVLHDLDGELAALVQAWEDSDLANLRRGIGSYHRRRQRSAPDILIASRALHREG